MKDLVLNDWKVLKKIEKINLETSKNENNEDYIANLALMYNLSINEITLSQEDNKLPKEIINDIFKSKKDFNIKNIHDESIYISKIEEIIMLNNKNDLNTISINADLRNSFGQELIKDKKISTNENLVNAIIQQY